MIVLRWRCRPGGHYKHMPEKFTVAVISPNPQIREQLASTFEENPQVEALWTLADYPGPSQLTRVREARGGCIVFLDFADPIRARLVAAQLDQNCPAAVTIAIPAGTGREDFIELMQLGIREVVVDTSEAGGAFERASKKLMRDAPSKEPGGEIHAFLPARPGSGATTLAVHSAAAAARITREQTLLVDFDLRLGMTSFLFKLHSQYSILDALAFSDRLEATLWDELVCRRDKLDILGSAPMEFDRQFPESGSGAVLDFARSKYGHIFVDLPGEMRQHELETLHRAKNIFLVCTSEVGTLHMAKRKADILQSLGIQHGVSVILNRSASRMSMEAADIEQVLRLPVRFTFPSAEKEIIRATQNAVALEGNSAAGTAIEHMARSITGIPRSATGLADMVNPRRLIEFFSVTPVRGKAGGR